MTSTHHPNPEPELTATEREFLARAVAQAEAALQAGDEPFGSVLVSADDEVLFEDHNHVSGGDHTRHPEFAIARWAAENLTPAQRRTATVYTSGEHCPMCAAAHGWVGLGRIIYASSSAQLAQWLGEFGLKPPPVATLPINTIVPAAQVAGPVAEFSAQVRDLFAQHVRKVTPPR